MAVMLQSGPYPRYTTLYINIFMDNIVREAKQRFDGGVEMETGTIQLILFADDLMLVTERDKDAERNVKVLDEVMTKWKMTINWRK